MKYTLMPGQPHEASEEETMSMIRSVLTEDHTPKKKRHQTKASKQADAPADQGKMRELRAFAVRTAQPAPRRRASDLPALAKAEPEPTQSRSSVRTALTHPVKALYGRIRGFQPTTRHIALACAALLFVLRPHWFVIGAVFSVILCVGAFLTLGADRIWRGVLRWLDRVEARNTARATRLRVRLDAFACRWDSVLDLFPDGMVDSLYMPDFQAMQQADAVHQAVVQDRLARMTQES